MDSAFPDNLRKLMKDRGLTIQQLADATGLKRTTVGGWLKDTAPRQLGDVKKVAAYFGVSFEWLLLGTVDDNPVQLLNSLPRQLFFDGYVKLRLEVVVPTNGKGE